MDEYRYPDAILETIQKNPILKNREDIFSDGLRLFREERYQSFVYLMVSQLEGLFHLYIAGNRIDDTYVAHGDIILVTEDMELEILADLHWLVEHVSDEKLSVMYWINFLSGIWTESRDLCETLEAFRSGSFNSHVLLGTLPK